MACLKGSGILSMVSVVSCGSSAGCSCTFLCACVQMNLAPVGVLHVAVALEDPFDNQGLDGIFVDEALFEAQQAWHVLHLGVPAACTALACARMCALAQNCCDSGHSATCSVSDCPG